GGVSANRTYNARQGTRKGAGPGEDPSQQPNPLEETALPPAPTVETKPASSITTTSATLNGTVNPNGGAVSECTFEYGTTPAYGKTAPCTPTPGSGMAPETVTADVSGLSPNTTQDFKLVAKNACGTGEESNQELNTLEAVIAPNAQIVELNSSPTRRSSDLTLNGTVNPNGGAVSECTFEYGTTPAYGKTVPCTPTPGSGMAPETVTAD